MTEKAAKKILRNTARSRRLYMRGLEHYPEPRSPSGIGVRPTQRKTHERC